MTEEKIDRVARFDTGLSLDSVKQDNGFLKLKATVGRVGVLEYRQADGSVRRELRHPEEVFSEPSLDSLAMVPVTLNHPPRDAHGGLVASDNAADYTVGHAGETPFKINQDRLGLNLMVTHDRAIKAIEDGVRQISPGYTTELEYKSGVYLGEPYDAIQRNIRYNHVAIVERGRAGPSVRLHLDSDAVEVDGTEDNKTEEPIMELVKINLDGVDFEVSEQAKQALEAQITRKDEEVTALEGKLAEASARADSLAADLEAEKEARTQETGPEVIQTAIKARLGLERQASEVLGEEVKLDELADRDVKVAVVEKVNPSVSEKLSCDVYLDAAFDLAVESFKNRPNQALADARADAVTAEVKTDSVDPKAAYDNALKNLWRK